MTFGRQQSYLSRDEFVARAQTEPLQPVFEGRSPDMRFNYPALRSFLEYMMRTRGRDALQNYMLAFMQTPDNWSSLFQQTSGIAFPDAIHEFEMGLREGTAP